MMGDGEGGCAVPGVVSDRDVNLVLRRDRPLEGDTVGLGPDVTDPVLDEEQALLLICSLVASGPSTSGVG